MSWVVEERGRHWRYSGSADVRESAEPATFYEQEALKEFEPEIATIYQSRSGGTELVIHPTWAGRFGLLTLRVTSTRGEAVELVEAAYAAWLLGGPGC